MEFEQRFPSLRLTTLIHVAPEAVAQRAYLFWLFNRCGLHTPLEKGGSNRHVLLWIDPDSLHLSATVGYGLEPILPDALIQESLAAATPLVTTGQHAQAAIAFIHQLDTGLANLHSQLPEIFGWFPDGTWTALEDDLDPFEVDRADGILSY